MPRNLLFLFASTRTKLALSLIAFMILAVMAVSARAWLRAPAAATTAPQEESEDVTDIIQESPSSTGPAPRRGPVQMVRFALYETQILPREISAQKGFVTIAIEDFTGGTEGLVVERAMGDAPERVGQIRRVEGHGRGKGELEFAPGTYQVYDVGHPENRATLTIEP